MQVRLRGTVAAACCVLAFALAGCPSRVEEQRAELGASALDRSKAAEKLPRSLSSEPEAVLLFIPPPVSPQHPERAILTEQFRHGAAQSLADAGWRFRELDLAALPGSSWGSSVLAAGGNGPVVIFSYQDDFLGLLRGLVTEPGMEPATVVVALVEPRQELPPQFLLLEFHSEELGFIAGIIAGEMTVDGHVATYGFTGDYYSDLFVAGFWQGLMLGRSGASLRDLRVSRNEVADAKEGARLMGEMLNRVNREYDPQFAVDFSAFWTYPLGEEFAHDVAALPLPIVVGPVPSRDVSGGAPVTSLYYDFSAIPRFLVENAEELGLLEVPSPLDQKQEDDETAGAERARAPRSVSPALGPRRVEIRMDSGLMKIGGFDAYRRYNPLPADLLKTVEFYLKSLQLGELEVKPELPGKT